MWVIGSSLAHLMRSGSLSASMSSTGQLVDLLKSPMGIGLSSSLPLSSVDPPGMRSETWPCRGDTGRWAPCSPIFIHVRALILSVLG